jgi:hypothetical protein
MLGVLTVREISKLQYCNIHSHLIGRNVKIIKNPGKNEGMLTVHRCTDLLWRRSANTPYLPNVSQWRNLHHNREIFMSSYFLIRADPKIKNDLPPIKLPSSYINKTPI